MHINCSSSKINIKMNWDLLSIDLQAAPNIFKQEKTMDRKKEKNKVQQPIFSLFLSSLGMQAMIAMGKIESPLTKKTENNFEQAQFLITNLEMIKEKTINNLSDEEEKLLDEYLVNLKVLYAETKKNDR